MTRSTSDTEIDHELHVESPGQIGERHDPQRGNLTFLRFRHGAKTAYLLPAAGFTDRLERMADPPVVVIASATAVTALKVLPGVGRQIMVFADTDALRAVEAIAMHKPNLIVLQREFLDTPRCAALISRVKTDPDLSHAQIRVLSEVAEYEHLLSRRSQAGLDPATAVPGEPLSADYDGVRLTRRFKVHPGLEMRLDGYPTTLVDLSRSGAQVLVAKPLRFKQGVRISIADEQGAFRFRATVVWAAFERSADTGQQCYRAGIAFVDADAQLLDELCVRHRVP